MRAETLKINEDADFIPRPQAELSVLVLRLTADDPDNTLHSLSESGGVGGVFHGAALKSKNSVISICAWSRAVSAGRLKRVSISFKMAV